MSVWTVFWSSSTLNAIAQAVALCDAPTTVKFRSTQTTVKPIVLRKCTCLHTTARVQWRHSAWPEARLETDMTSDDTKNDLRPSLRILDFPTKSTTGLYEIVEVLLSTLKNTMLSAVQRRWHVNLHARSSPASDVPNRRINDLTIPKLSPDICSPEHFLRFQT